jgi:Trm5-related predicted tRNA methylase
MQLCHHINKISREPFHFHFCNVLPGSKTKQKLDKGLLQNKDEVITVNEHHYTECFPKSQLVYLSPNAPTPMTRYDPDDVYVIGCIVDKAVEHPLTLARAKQEKLRTVRLPLDEHVK